MPALTRRQVLMSLPALALAPRAFAQAAPIRARSLNHFGIAVSDPKRSVDFYQGLFGMPELYFTDPDGILMQLQDTRYCGGGGFLGDACPK